MASISKKSNLSSYQIEILQECDSCGELFSQPSANVTVCRRCLSYARRTETKKKAIEYKGGQCFKCGYNRCDGALHFHHFLEWTEGFFTEEEKVKYKKRFSIGNRSEMSFEKLKEELDRCVLLCSNHHAELHAGLWSLKKEDLKLC